jgi:hypothetical protein
VLLYSPPLLKKADSKAKKLRQHVDDPFPKISYNGNDVKILFITTQESFLLTTKPLNEILLTTVGCAVVRP